MLKSVCVLLGKDLLVELRAKETLALIIMLPILLSIVCAFALNSAFLNQDIIAKLCPAIIWLVFVFCASIAMGKSFDLEIENSAFEGLILSGASSSLIFVSKVISNSLLILASHLIALVTLALFVGIHFSSFVNFDFALISILVVIAYACLSTLFGAVAVFSRLKNALLPLIMLPLIFPLFFSAIELSNQIMLESGLNLNCFAFSLLIALDLIYFILGLALFEYVIKE